MSPARTGAQIRGPVWYRSGMAAGGWPAEYGDLRAVSEKRAGNRGKGRKKGVPNKVTAAVKDAVLGALNEVGGQAYLVRIARKNPAVFCVLLGRLIPTEVKSSLSGTVRLQLVEEIVDGDPHQDGPPAPSPG